MDNLPLDIKREIGSFGMFAPNLPATAAGAMVEFIKSETGRRNGSSENGVTVHFEKCGVQFMHSEPYDAEDSDDSEDESYPARMCAYIHGLETYVNSRGTHDEQEHKRCSRVCPYYRFEDATADGLIRLIHRIKPMIVDIEKRGFCKCSEWRYHLRNVLKLKGIDMCGQCAINVAMGAPTK